MSEKPKRLARKPGDFELTMPLTAPQLVAALGTLFTALEHALVLKADEIAGSASLGSPTQRERHLAAFDAFTAAVLQKTKNFAPEGIDGTDEAVGMRAGIDIIERTIAAVRATL